MGAPPSPLGKVEEGESHDRDQDGGLRTLRRSRRCTQAEPERHRAGPQAVGSLSERRHEGPLHVPSVLVMERDAEARMWDEHERLGAALDTLGEHLYYFTPDIGEALYRLLADRVEKINTGLRKERQREMLS